MTSYIEMLSVLQAPLKEIHQWPVDCSQTGLVSPKRVDILLLTWTICWTNNLALGDLIRINPDVAYLDSAWIIGVLPNIVVASDKPNNVQICLFNNFYGHFLVTYARFV